MSDVLADFPLHTPTDGVAHVDAASPHAFNAYGIAKLVDMIGVSRGRLTQLSETGKDDAKLSLTSSAYSCTV